MQKNMGRTSKGLYEQDDGRCNGFEEIWKNLHT